MKNVFKFSVLVALLAISITGCELFEEDEPDPDPDPEPVKNKTVTVGEQQGRLIAKTAGTVTFPVTTDYIANGSYNATVASLPTGVSVQGQVVINANKGSLTLAGNTSTVAGAYSTLKLTIDGATSPAFTLTIEGAGDCDPTGAPASTDGLERCSVRYTNQNGDVQVFSYMAKGRIWRMDQWSAEDYEAKSWPVSSVYNEPNKTHWNGHWLNDDEGEEWIDFPFIPNNVYVLYCPVNECAYRSLLQSNKMTILGKECNVYKMSSAGVITTFAVWKGVRLWLETVVEGEKYSFTATKIVEAVPDKAFTKTLKVDWI